MAYNDLDVQNIRLPDPINAGEITVISNDLSVILVLNVSETPLSEILDEVAAIENLVNLATFLNNPASSDTEPSKSQISNVQLQRLFDTHRCDLDAAIDNVSPSTASNNDDVANHVRQIQSHMEEVLKKSNDQVLSNAATNFISRTSELNFL